MLFRAKGGTRPAFACGLFKVRQFRQCVSAVGARLEQVLEGAPKHRQGRHFSAVDERKMRLLAELFLWMARNHKNSPSALLLKLKTPQGPRGF
jgi:hypothetical protein